MFQRVFGLILAFLSALALGACGTPEAARQAEAQIAAGLVNGKSDFTAASFGVILRGEKGILCSGTVIDRRLILTAAHCGVAFLERGAPVGILKSGLNPDGEVGALQVGVVQRWRIHPSYRPKTESHGFDLALALADRDLTPSLRVMPLAPEAWTLASASSLMFIGAGSQNPRPDLNDKPSEVQSGAHMGSKRLVRETNFSALRDFFSTRPAQPGDVFELWRDDLRDTYICSGDSGGALVSKDGDSWLLVGVTVATNLLPGSGKPTCFGSGMKVAPVPAHRAWIRDASAQLLAP
ncbi:MAG: S1 family peptidase [Bdellovibrionaceae bacterium]|nr:S1 family peptidase [Pseudobdellovibrionaceae bacterium]MBX3034935.1 S1 family peptidase [Pseudobdellovibrionaceae bacterium]